MAIDTPATIAILGAGPIGLETALYARFLGYDVIVYERGDVAENVRQWGHVRLFSPFQLLSSPLAIAAIQAHQAEETSTLPAPDDILSGAEWRHRYLLPLAATDLLADHLRLRTRVLGVTRTELLKGDLAGQPARGDWMFRIVWEREDGTQGQDEAEIVIDTTGVWGQPNNAGEGGLPALGETAAQAAGGLRYDIPDVLGRDRAQFAGKQTCVIGAGHSAATTVVAIARLAEEVPGTQVVWLVRREPTVGQGPVADVPDDSLPLRRELALAANRLATDGHPAVKLLAGSWLNGVTPTADGRWQLDLGGQHAGPIVCDRVVTNVGFRPDVSLFRELQVELCPASEAPRAAGSILLITEPNFYILGSKSYGRKAQFLFANGLAQIRALFALIGDRADLDLYRTVRPLT